jgi:hypothetical protein
MFYVIDKQSTSKEKEFTDFNFENVKSSKKALWHSVEDAAYGISCFIKDFHAADNSYTKERYEIVEE